MSTNGLAAPDALQATPYARFMGMQVHGEGDAQCLRLPFAESQFGNAGLRALHGGVLAALCECAALCRLAPKLPAGAQPQVVSLTVEFLRGGQDRDTFAQATVTRMGRRVASVRVITWQESPDRPLNTAMLQILLAG